MHGLLLESPGGRGVGRVQLLLEPRVRVQLEEGGSPRELLLPRHQDVAHQLGGGDLQTEHEAAVYEGLGAWGPEVP